MSQTRELSDPPYLATVSTPLIEDWIDALRKCCSEDQLSSVLRRSGMDVFENQTAHRVSLDQIVRLYQIAAIETGDEMMGLWSRPIRARALQHLLTTVREATTLSSALYRFSTFWNLLLDDYRLVVASKDNMVTLQLIPQEDQEYQRFGHMLLLKLAHGLLSWLAGYELRVLDVQFAFDRPEFAEDYSVIFPAPVGFAAPMTSISFQTTKLDPTNKPGAAELKRFLDRAPRDWIFTRFREHTQSLRVREFLYRMNWEECHLRDAAQAMKVTPRTLIRRLDAEGTSFQAIKDGLRRDLAIRDLQAGSKSIEEVSQDIGFSSAANFHRAFRRWTGATPSSYRKPRLQI
ncbi:MAG: helix-turn-helix domain-containing protein [Silicimonas sp.]|nr:helix-turn-helix domain-containing protein [Silicimonas sp.]